MAGPIRLQVQDHIASVIMDRPPVTATCRRAKVIVSDKASTSC